MRESLLDLLRCPAGCPDSLSLHADGWRDGEAVSGFLVCSACGREYPIQEGIPRLLPAALTESGKAAEDETIARKRSEMQARDAQVEDYDRLLSEKLFALIEIPTMLSALALSPEHILLEGGCGTGRMTRRFATRCKELVSIDFSWESLRINREKLRRDGVRNVHLLQADLCALPFRDEVFDRVTSCQVIEHIPTPQSRETAVAQLARVAKCGGNLAISAYQYSLIERLFGAKEGEHPGGIYFVRFTREELRALLSRPLKVEAISGALVYLFVARCRKEGCCLEQPTQPQTRKATWRMGARERMRLQWLIVAIISIVFIFFVGMPYAQRIIQTRDYQTCQENVLKIARGITIYSQDYDETLPPAASWMVSAEAGMGATSGTGFGVEHYFHCPQDKSGASSSYAYNDLLSGFSLNVREKSAAEDARWKTLVHPFNAPLVIEKHGGPLNAHLLLPDWDAVRTNMTLPHHVPEPTGMTIVTGGQKPAPITDERLNNLAGRKF